MNALKSGWRLEGIVEPGEQVAIDEQLLPQRGYEVRQAPVKRALHLQTLNQQHRDQSCPYLCLNSVLAGAHEGFDFHRLLQGLERLNKALSFMHVDADGSFIPCVQEINSKNVLFHVDDVSSYHQVIDLLRRARPIFDICNGCQLKRQDLVDYYVRFLLKYFPDRAAGMF